MFVSDYNRLAFQFADHFSFAQAPAVTVMIGNEGIGKTTLLEYLYRKTGDAVDSSVFIDAQKFGVRYSFAAQNGELGSFRKKIRSSKLLLLDNIQVLKGKTKTIEELFHSLDYILAKGGKAVITSRGDALCLDYLGERLASRLRSGLILRILNPTVEEICDFFTYYITSTQVNCVLNPEPIRKAVNMKQVVDYVHSQKNSSDETMTKSNSYILGSIKDKVELVLPLVSGYYSADEVKIRNGSKNSSNVRARYMACLLLNEIFHFSYQDISIYFNRDLYYLREECTKMKARERETFETLCQKLYNQLDIIYAKS
ncbi:MAG: ATP-binding protein [Peptococcaceae bacterium]|nr:ATP-binding protein [Peptococcaceae bacterium]